MNNLFWTNTLESYLNNSNEDDVLLNAFIDVLPKSTIDFKKEVKWIEIGPGPLTKSKRIFKEIYEQARDVHPIFIEPSSVWKAKIIESWTQSNFILHNFLLEDIWEGLELSPNTIMSIIHVLYTDEVTEAFFKLLNRIKKDSFVFVVVEDVSSDFYQMRNELAQRGINTCQSQVLELNEKLEAYGYNYERQITSNKQCILSEAELENDDYWLYPFLLGLDTPQWNSLGDEKAEIIRNIKNYIKDKGTSILNIEDSIYLIQK